MSLRKLLMAATALVVLSGCASLQEPRAAAPGVPNPAHVDQVLKGFTDTGKLVGVSALVTENGKEVYFGAFGAADREAGRKMARDTIVSIYSMTKPITGVALMSLWEEGKFRLDDPVAKYIPELANVKVYAGTDASGAPILTAPNRPMTIRDVARHTAGLTYCSKDNLPELKAGCDAANPLALSHSLDDFAKALGSLPLEYQPGEKWRYSFGVDVQALLVQRISGKPFAQYVQEKILTPLHMTDTGFFVPPEKRDRLAAIYERDEDGTFTRKIDDTSITLNTGHWAMTPGGFGLTSTLDDYSRFARMLAGGGELDGVRILKPATVKLMSTSVLDPAVTERSWLPSKGTVGFGIDFAVRTDPPQTADEAAGEVGEFFWDGAAYTLFWVDPKNKLTAVFFTQYQPFGKVPAHKAFRDAVYAGVDPSALPPQ
ncbi:serine hydrolase domain-containing protein [Rhizomicrobium electricum]|uniref:Serine hydrolase domain-containing protein n=1 Tax=Rhizomicrobium electricum TaxID=480070 RepID=A0ABP3PY48_9PROT|nr:serine hydrolase domain-containing protein [Rhizomicrobium electricum]NIJ49679.1 CubicO group peptidase (beta-lactamase class C family) [Rhizomicrobium electricum]